MIRKKKDWFKLRHSEMKYLKSVLSIKDPLVQLESFSIDAILDRKYYSIIRNMISSENLYKITFKIEKGELTYRYCKDDEGLFKEEFIKKKEILKNRNVPVFLRKCKKLNDIIKDELNSCEVCI